MSAEWTYLLADLRTNYITAEVPLSGVRISTRLGAAGTMSGTWTMSSRWAGDDPYGLTRPARTAMYALRDGRPIWGGIVWTSNRDSDSDSVQLSAGDWWTYFDHRRVVPLLPGSPTTSSIASLSAVYTALDQNEIARQLVALAQSHVGGNIGIVADTADSGVVRDRTWFGYELAETGTALRQLSEVSGGPDLLFGVAANLDANGRPVRTLRIGTPLLGQPGAPWTFEWGANILSYTWPSDGTRMATRTYALGEGAEQGAQIAVAENFAAYEDGWPLLEADANYSTVTDAATLQGHADADLTVGRLPVALPTLRVAGSGLNRHGDKVYPAIGEFEPGDQATVAIKDTFFRTGISTRMRIVAVDLDPGNDGVETAALTMASVTDNIA